jgi:hypothetical protein
VAVAAGQIIDVDDQYRRIATQTYTTNSGNVTTTETSIGQVTGALVAGVTYGVRLVAAVDSDTASTQADCRLREDSAVGTEMTLRRVNCADASGRWPVELYAEFTAVSTGSKTFHATLVRASAGGTFVRAASATIPTYLYIEKVSG